MTNNISDKVRLPSVFDTNLPSSGTPATIADPIGPVTISGNFRSADQVLPEVLGRPADQAPIVEAMPRPDGQYDFQIPPFTVPPEVFYLGGQEYPIAERQEGFFVEALPEGPRFEIGEIDFGKFRRPVRLYRPDHRFELALERQGPKEQPGRLEQRIDSLRAVRFETNWGV
ncbi:MAG: hypothetical protein RIT81_32085 [Deltaproteobacteria bacterium]